MVDLPLPVAPTRATVLPPGTVKDTLRSTGAPSLYCRRDQAGGGGGGAREEGRAAAGGCQWLGGQPSGQQSAGGGRPAGLLPIHAALRKPCRPAANLLLTVTLFLTTPLAPRTHCPQGSTSLPLPHPSPAQHTWKQTSWKPMVWPCGTSAVAPGLSASAGCCPSSSNMFCRGGGK